jgi:hypothetical protein
VGFRLRLLLLLSLRPLNFYPRLMAAIVATMDRLVGGGDISSVLGWSAAPFANRNVIHSF